MPHGAHGERRFTGVIGCAATLTPVAIGESQDTAFEHPGRRKEGAAGCRIPAAAFSPGRSGIA